MNAINTMQNIREQKMLKVQQTRLKDFSLRLRASML